MTTLQKIIKYLALAFAIFLILAIISGVVGVFTAIAGIAAWRDDRAASSEPADVTFDASEVRSLDMEIAAANIRVLCGDELNVETDNPYISVYTSNNGTLHIEEESHIGDLDGSTLTVYIPEDMVFDEANITTGAGRIQAEQLVCRELDLELGAGEAEFQTLTVTDSADIEGGAGQIVVHDGRLHDLAFEMGVGEGDIVAVITGDSQITAGVGALYLTIPASPEDYTIHAEQGIGRIEIDNTHITGESTVGSGPNRLELDGGIGNITVDFES